MRTTLLALVLLLLTACATNPATGRSEFNIVSEQQELAMGKEAHEQVLAEYGVYDEKPELNAMVDRIGHEIAASSPRPNLPWTFTLLDTPMVNAMALPGGYIYVTRGILERMNSEDELAGVIGHEVAHVAARHSAQSISRATLAQVGLAAAMVAAGYENTERYGWLAAVGVGLLFTKYSRSQETQADVLGTDYMSGAGWNPYGSANMLQGLQRLQGGRTAGIERYFMDHPDPAKRVEDVKREIAKLDAVDPSREERPMQRDSFVRLLDGALTGNNTTATIIKGNTVYNRTYGLVAQSPRGWKAMTEAGSLFAFVPENGQEVIYAQELSEDELRGHDTPREAVQAQLEKLGLTRVDSDRVNTFTIDRWKGTSNGTSYTAATTQQNAGDGAVALLHLVQGTSSSSALDEVVRTLEVNSPKAAKVKPPRLRVRAAKKGETWDSLARGEDAAELAHLNGFDYPSEVPAGLMVKIRE
ncbi:MAG TPA: M48 family metalloprotease [Thermoanaerobaculia bacterium]|nr:M48 family metalloprotease [Thermoanaerobaculia bacterium]